MRKNSIYYNIYIIKLYFSIYFIERQINMGNCSGKDLVLQQLLQRPKTGRIIRLSGQEKKKFIQEQLEISWENNRIRRLQPAVVNRHTGFLYKKGVFFYEGHILGYDIMEKTGNINLIKKKLKYQGEFKDNKPHGQGNITTLDDGMTIRGIWKNGFTKEVHFQDQRMKYTMELQSRERQPKNFPGNIKASLIYPDKRRYQGFLRHQNGRYQVTGEGVLRNPNGDTLQGKFQEGILQGKGIYNSPSKGRYEGDFKNGKFNGRGTFFYPDGKSLKIFWLNNRPQGKGSVMILREGLPPIQEVVFYSDGQRILSKQSIVRQ